jgi:hypothetical protein
MAIPTASPKVRAHRPRNARVMLKRIIPAIRPVKNMPAIAMTCPAVLAAAAVGPKLTARITVTMAPMPTAITWPGRIRVIQSKTSNGTNGNPAAFQAK